MANEDDDRRRDSGRSWTSIFKPTDSRRLEEARNKRPTLDEFEQQLTEWVQQQDTQTRSELQQRLPQVRQELASQREREDSEINPFVAFKSFVDDGLAAIAQMPARMHARQKEQAATQEKEDKWRHWSGRNDTINYMDPSVGDFAEAAWPSLPKDAQERAREATLMLLNEAIVRNAHVPTHKLARLYWDQESFPYGRRTGVWGRVKYHSFPWLENDFSVAKKLGISPPWWLSVGWFQHSPYSPVNLERHQDLGSFDTKWRNAFEDLLEATLDKPMSSEERFGMRPPYFHPTPTWRGSGLDWMLSLQCRGILPPQVPSLYGPQHQTSLGLGVPNPDRFADLANAFESKTRGWVETDLRTLLVQVAIPPDTKLDDSQPTELDMYEQQTAHAGVCPDDVGAAIQEAVRQEQSAYLSGDHSVGRCPDDLGRAVQEAADEQETENEDPSPTGNHALQDYQMQLMLLERQNKLRLLRQRELEEERAQSGECQDELGRQGQLASDQEQQRRCPDEMGRLIGAVARQTGDSVDELLEKLDEDEYDDGDDDDEDEDEDELTPGELWSLEQQIKEREKQQHREAAYRNYRSWITGTEGPWERPTHEAMARHWDRLERLSEQYDTRSMSPEAATAQEATDDEKPVSTSMTTLTTRSADGNVTTKIVRKVRYADGREENSESVQTSQGEQFEHATIADEKPKKGWFWS